MGSIGEHFGRMVRPTIKSKQELRAFTARTVAFCVTVALAADIANQLSFFVDWPTALRSWTITVVVAGSLAALVSWLIARAHFELYEAKLAVDQLSRTDPLTGLPNRRAVFEAVERMSPDAMVLVIVDIDRFKRVNDTRGHLVGDEVICALARMMALDLSPLGILGRIGGEEFALVSSGNDPAKLAAVISGFRRRVADTPIVAAGAAVTITVSVGVALRLAYETFSDLYADADRALYRAKTEGRNRTCFAASFVEPGIGDVDEANWRIDADTERDGRTQPRDEIQSVA
jgi:diguanylate cyclase (GGDEF)-like protein